MVPPVFAVENILGIIILVLTVLGWFVKAIKDQQAKAPPRVERRNNPDQVRTEIQDFLDELSGSGPKRPAVREKPPQRPQPKPAERARPPVAKPVNKQSGKKSNKPAKVPAGNQSAEPVIPLSESHLASSNLGAGLRSHVSTYMQADRVEREVQSDLRNRVGEAVQADLGSRSANAAKVAVAPIHPFILAIREPIGLRQAIIMQEVLQKPKALRRG